MDTIDRKICKLIQHDGKLSSAALADALGLPISTANDRLRRLGASGVIAAWRGVLDPARVGAGLCAFLFIDMSHDGETEAAATLKARSEVMELHHVSGAHSYLAKVRVADMPAMQKFLSEVVKPLKAVTRTETVFALDTLKETSEVAVAPPPEASPS
ncbi:MAG: Lrp/AsnC family transcriptional regulator [Hyphomicrobiales bacterium]|nr:MAG: Lrp/AsnC family transcriptional regulator [Hyphomicrobiales bacterium]